jgi:hypothetical protein
MSWLLTNPKKPYIEASKTDVLTTWRRFGFVPPSELKLKARQEVKNEKPNKG